MTERSLYIIIDSPSRDLRAWCAVLPTLEEYFEEIYFISMTSLYRRWMQILPRIPAKANIIYNYRRITNEKLLRFSSLLGHRIFIYDTEGAPYSHDDFWKIQKCEEIISLHLIWGKRLYLSGVSAGVNPLLLRVVGSIRHIDLPMEYRIKNRSLDIDYLICSKSAFAYPRYSTPESEFLSELRFFGNSLNRALRTYREDILARQYVIQTCLEIRSEFPHSTIALRLHPFESLDAEIANLLLDRNIEIQHDGDIHNLLQRTKVLLNAHCSTAADAFLHKKTVVNCSWWYPNSSNFNSDISTYTSGSLQDCISFLRSQHNVELSSWGALSYEQFSHNYGCPDESPATLLSSEISSCMDRKSLYHWTYNLLLFALLQISSLARSSLRYMKSSIRQEARIKSSFNISKLDKCLSTERLVSELSSVHSSDRYLVSNIGTFIFRIGSAKNL